MTQVVQTPSVSRYPGVPDPSFGGITGHPSSTPHDPGETDFAAIQRSPEFVALRKRFRRFVFPVTALFLLWYLTYVVLAAFARDFMGYRLVGSVTVGLVLGLLQFASTIAITVWYLRFARNKIDPQVAAIRAGAGVANT